MKSELEIYRDIARFRVMTKNSINSKRDPKLIFRDIDRELFRIFNNISKGYHLDERYRYFTLTSKTMFDRSNFDLSIHRPGFSLHLTDEEWSKFYIWTHKWKTYKPETTQEAEDLHQYARWW